MEGGYVANESHIASWRDDSVVRQLLELGDEPPDEDILSSGLRTQTAADSTFDFGEPTQTLIFLDWDDTLFPSTDIFDRWGWPSKSDLWEKLSFTEEQERVLARWRTELDLYLRTAASLSHRCVILTNAQPGWVDHCIDRFAPELKTVITRDGARVVYAREGSKLDPRLSPGSLRGNSARNAAEMSEAEYHDQLTKAKFVSMRTEAKDFYSQYPDQTWKNILSVGDAKYEHDAAQDLAFRRKGSERERLRLKSVITPACPTVSDLTYRLRLATLLWRALVKFDGDVDLDMNTPERLQAIANALDMPELHNVIRPTPIREEDEAALEEDFDEVVILVQNRMSE